MARTFPRPPAQHPGCFENFVVLPELTGSTADDLAQRGKAIKVFCRACGREVVITPTGLRALDDKVRHLPIETLVSAMVCETCGAREGQATGWVLEGPDTRHRYVRQEHWRATFKRTG